MYQIPELPYLFQDFEPYIDTHTMGLHYNKHHKNYLKNLNNLLMKNNYDYKYSLNELVYHVDKFDDKDDILFNLGGVLNHNLYWKSISPKRKEPSGELMKYIDNKYGSFDKFWEVFKSKALELKGSGYTFLVMDKNGGVDVMNTSNQDTPLSLGLFPLFNIDMWEHAYYINHENEKAKYIDNFKEVADFTYASIVFGKLIKK